MWYIYNQRGIIVATCSMEPDEADLDTRGEAAFYSDDLLELGWMVLFGDNGKPIGAEPTAPPGEEAGGQV